ncbi:hypothetical protein [Methanosarcina barkeri]|uniref:Uncharacterized protein n=1 Tax=Methanosarcina barkeri CM1 TaxID=796385 RepID=A0A0G3C6P1_METBA|nr:hypothetical protein [Methanosarcina barkeri]AKJ37649.1 hypothetical protein MCM1_0551 [Methanosarcina barkeri CM1]
MSKPKYVEFPVGINKRYLDDACYELDRETGTLTISFEGDFYNFPKERAPNLINLLGLETITTLKVLTKSVYMLLFFLLILKMILKKDYLLLWMPLFFAGMIFVFVASYLDEIENYYNISRCKKCDREFAYEEIKKPFIKIVSTYDKYEETTTRYMKCKYCNSEDIKIKIDQRNSKSKPKNINKNRKTCRGCGKKFALVEYRSPDIHFEYPNIFITIRHYKCAHCGYMAISIKYDYVATS